MKVRIKFAKTGSLRYVGHLDFMRAVQKIIRRSGIEAAFTKGFSPHHIMSFASPLGVGLESVGEYFDLELAYRDPFEMDRADLSRLNSIGLENDELPDVPAAAWILGRLNDASPEGVRFLGMKRVGENSSKAMAQVRAADYSVFLTGSALGGRSVPELLSSFLKETEIIVHKVTKKTESDVNIRPLILSLMEVTDGNTALCAGSDGQCRADDNANVREGQDCSDAAMSAEQSTLAARAAQRIRGEGYPVRLDMTLGAGSAANLKPETVVEAMCAFAEIPYDPSSLRILRREMYMEGGKTLIDEGLAF